MRKVRGGYFETVGIMRHLIFQPKVWVGGFFSQKYGWGGGGGATAKFCEYIDFHMKMCIGILNVL